MRLLPVLIPLSCSALRNSVLCSFSYLNVGRPEEWGFKHSFWHYCLGDVVMALLPARHRRLSQSFPRDALQPLPGTGLTQNAGSVPFVRRLHPAGSAQATTATSDSDHEHRAYTYDDLKEDEIRLLNLHPGRPDDELNASLEIYHLSVTDLEIVRDEGVKVRRKLLEEKKLPRPDYEALSYYWGNKAENRYQFPIKILKENKPFRKFLRPNLDSALRHLRLETEERFLWVDALCLNQNDDADGHKEKSIQIPRMHLIYNKAKSVCIWLDPSDETSESAMDFVKDLLNLHTFDRVFQDAGNVHLLATFAHLLRREWFGRRWVVQELAVARAARLYCGSKYVPWEDFAGAVALFSSRHVDLKRIFKESKAHGFDSDYLGDVRELGAFRLVHAANNFFRKSDDGEILEHLVPLEEVVSTLTMFDAGDPRDIIYAVLSLSRNATASSKNKSAFKLDEDRMDEYLGKSVLNSPEVSTTEEFPLQSFHRRGSSDWRVRAAFAKAAKLLQGKRQPNNIITIKYNAPVFEVYKDFMEHTILHSKSIDIICRPWAAEVERLPSWITGKTKAVFGVRDNKAFSRINADLLVGSASPEDKNYSASQDSRAKWDYRDHFVLKRSLVVQGFVLDTIDQKLTPALGGIIPEEWYKVWEENREKTRQPSSAFWRTLAADRGFEGQKPPPAYYELACNYAFKNRVNEGYLDTRDMIKYCPSIVKEFLGRVQAVTWMRRLILTKDRAHIRLGLVPYNTKKKDLICILQGCSVPVVLRRHETETLIKQELSNLEPIPIIKVLSPSEDGEVAAITDSIDRTDGGPLFDFQDQGTITGKSRTEPSQEARYRDLAEALMYIRSHLTTRRFSFAPESTSAIQDEYRSHEGPPRSPMTSTFQQGEPGPGVTYEVADAPSKGMKDQSTPLNVHHGAADMLPVRRADIRSTANAVSRGATDTNAGHTAAAPVEDDKDASYTTESDDPPGIVPKQDHRNARQPSSKESQTQTEAFKKPKSTPKVPVTDSTSPASPPTTTKVEAPKHERKPSINTTMTPEPRKLRKEDRILSWKDQTMPRYYYELVGECYIHGMMDGEAMRFSDRTDIPTTEREEFDPKQGRRQVFWLR